MTRTEPRKANESVYALNDSASGSYFVSNWQNNSKREYPQKEIDCCGCGCATASKA